MSELERGAEAKSIAATVYRLADLLTRQRGELSAGDVAAVRRMDPRRIDAPAFYKLLGELPDFEAGDGVREDLEERWAAIIVALAHLGDLNRKGARLGAALVEAGFSEHRFVRLLRADKERIVDEVPAMARFLAAKGIPADLVPAAWLVLSAGRRDEERARRELARDYYHSLLGSQSDRKKA